jgi:hypothetical protein
MVNGHFDTKDHPEVKDAMDESRVLVDRLINDYIRIGKVAECDPAGITIFLREAQKLKNLMCDNFLTPYGPNAYITHGESETAKKRRIREEAVAPAAADA